MVLFFSHFLSLFTILFVFSDVASALKKPRSFSGNNLYYAPGLNPTQRAYLLDGMKSAGMKVLRVWLDGHTTASTKNTPITPYKDLEHSAIGVYDDTVLNLLDDFMIDSHKRGIKLIICMHSFNALSSGDIYGKKYGVQGFYENSHAQAQFDARLRHIVNHKHKTLHKPWKELSAYIFAFEPQNEPMIGLGAQYVADHPQWQCNRAKTIKKELPTPGKPYVMSGGASWIDESVQDGLLKCSGIDVLGVHAYTAPDMNTERITQYINRAKKAGTKLMLSEWGVCSNCVGNVGFNERNKDIQVWSDAATAAGIPWLYWQVIPNHMPENYSWNYEIGINIDPLWPALKKAALKASTATCAFDFSSGFLD